MYADVATDTDTIGNSASRYILSKLLYSSNCFITELTSHEALEVIFSKLNPSDIKGDVNTIEVRTKTKPLNKCLTTLSSSYFIIIMLCIDIISTMMRDNDETLFTSIELVKFSYIFDFKDR